MTWPPLRHGVRNDGRAASCTTRARPQTGIAPLGSAAMGVVAAAESYVGLVEAGVGLIPGGGGTKEFALRASDAFREGDVQMNVLIEKFQTIATAKVATSADEAFKFGYFQTNKM